MNDQQEWLVRDILHELKRANDRLEAIETGFDELTETVGDLASSADDIKAHLNRWARPKPTVLPSALVQDGAQ